MSFFPEFFFISVIDTSHIQLYLCSSFQHKIAKCITFISYNICVTNDHWYFPFVVNTSRSFPHPWLITGFVTKLTLRVPLVEQELLTLPEHLSSPPVFSGDCVTRSLVLCVCFVDCCLSFCTFYFGHCVVCSSSIYGFWLPLWYPQTSISTFTALFLLFHISQSQQIMSVMYTLEWT